MNYMLDVMACGLIVLAEIVGVCIVAILIQGIVYRLTGFSIYKAIKDSMEKEIYSCGKHMYISRLKK